MAAVYEKREFAVEIEEYELFPQDGSQGLLLHEVLNNARQVISLYLGEGWQITEVDPNVKLPMVDVGGEQKVVFFKFLAAYQITE